MTSAEKPGWRNRIVGHGEENPEQLLANPLNWRIQPQNQQDALGAVLDDVGWVHTVIVNQRTGFVVDGHLRVAMAISHGDEAIPVTYVDLSEEEEALVLVSLDPLGALATADSESLSEKSSCQLPDSSHWSTLASWLKKSRRVVSPGCS